MTPEDDTTSWELKGLKSFSRHPVVLQHQHHVDFRDHGATPCSSPSNLVVAGQSLDDGFGAKVPWVYGALVLPPMPGHQLRYDMFLCMRVGEASHPGPHGSRRTARKRKEQEFGNFGGLLQLLMPFLEKLVFDVLSKALGDGGIPLQRLNGPAKSKKPKKTDTKKSMPPAQPADCKANPSAGDTRHSAAGSVADFVKKGAADIQPGKGGKSPGAKGKGKGSGQPPQKQGAANAASGWTEVTRKLRKPADSRPWQLRGGDWDSPIITFDKIAAEIDAQKDALRGVVVVRTAEDATLLRSMLTGSGYKFAVLAIVLAKCDGHQLTRVPGECNGVVAFKEACVVKMVSAGLQAPQPAGMPQKPVKVAQKKSTVVLVKMLKRFAKEDEWRDATKAPQKSFFPLAPPSPVLRP
eukprot:s4156_g6.t1